MFISTAWAQGAGGGVGGFLGGLEGLLPILLIFVVFYFLLIRLQQKRPKQHRDMLTIILLRDRVIRGVGLFGTVTKVVSDGELVVQIAEAVKVRVARGTISEVVSKTEPAQAGKTEKAA